MSDKDAKIVDALALATYYQLDLKLILTNEEARDAALKLLAVIAQETLNKGVRKAAYAAIDDTPQADADWDLVVRKLSHSSDEAVRDHRQWENVYLLGDGFGKVDRVWAKEQCWDWSHVRDSSPAAVRIMAAKLRSWGHS